MSVPFAGELWSIPVEVAAKRLICPVSSLRIDETAARVAGFLMAASFASMFAATAAT